MADVSVNVGVTGIQQFKSGMSDAQASIKGLDAALKLNEKQLKQSGNAEKDMATRADLLNGKLEAQRRLLKNAEDALKQMEANGVRKSSKAYQDMQRNVLEAQSAIMDTQGDIENLGKVSMEAAGKTDELSKSLGGLNKKVSLEQVIGVVDKLTGGMEKAAKKAVDLGKAIWENITDAARWSDDTATQAMVLNMGIEEYQQYKGVFDTLGEITVQEWQKAKLKVQSALNKPTNDQVDILKALGINTKEWKQMSGQSGPSLVAKDAEEMFWEIGATLKRKVESGELTQDLADVYANAIFGKGFAQMNPMFELGVEGFNQALKDQAAASEEAVKKNAELYDKLIQLQNSYNALKVEVLSGLAPGLTGAADSLNKLLGSVMEYLQTPEGQQALQDLETAVSGLFDDLGKIDPEEVVKGFTGVLDKVVGGIQWLDENKENVVNTLKYIVEGWAGLKLLGGALQIYKLIQGLTGLAGGGTAAAAGEAGAAAGTSFATGFTNAFVSAAPALASLLGITSLAILPAAKVMEDVKKKWGEDYERRMEAAGKAGENEILIRTAAEALGKDGQVDFGTVESLLMGLQNRKNQQRAELYNMLSGSTTAGSSTWNVLNEFWNGKELDPTTINELVQNITDAFAENASRPKVEVDPEMPADANQQLAEQIGTVTVPVVFIPTTGDPVYTKRTPKRNGLAGLGYANGLPYVPMDGMYFLHQGEQVTTKREASKTLNSNLYVEKMVMNNGLDAQGLAGRIAAENQRVMSGFGS